MERAAVVARGLGWRIRGSYLMGTVSVLDEEVLEVVGGDGRTAVWMCFMPLVVWSEGSKW